MGAAYIFSVELLSKTHHSSLIMWALLVLRAVSGVICALILVLLLLFLLRVVQPHITPTHRRLIGLTDGCIPT